MRQETEFLPAALEVMEKPPSPAGRAIVWSVMLFFVLAVVWATVGNIDIVATAQGKIIPSGRVKVIQPMEIGVVRAIHVREGERVEAGDPLVDLDPTASQADLGRIEKDLIAARLDEARYRRLHAMTEEAGTDTAQHSDIGIRLALPPPLAERVGANAVRLHRQMLASEWSEQQARLAALDKSIESRRAEFAATGHEVKKLAGTLPLITRRADALKDLVAKKMGARQHWLELEEERIEQQQELAVLKDRVVQVAAAIDEARQQRRAREAEFKRTLLTRLSETERRIEQLTQERIKATQRTHLQHLVAPVTGVVQQLAVHTIGGVVTPAQALLKIVPDGESLEVEAWILNRDIGFVSEGQAAEVKIETFPFTKYGTIDAKVIDVSNDAVTDEQKGLVYAGRVLMRTSTIRVGQKRVNLTPGMAVTVEVKTGTRRLIEFVLSPLLRYKHESLGER